MSEASHTIVVTPDGKLKFVWDDQLVELTELGHASIARVGDVEPAVSANVKACPEALEAVAARGRAIWYADLSRIGGGRHGPYRFRETALEHERAVVIGRLVAGLI